MTSPNLIGGLGAAFDLSDVGDGTTPVGAALRAAFVSAAIVAGTGVDATGAADSTAAIQAIINAAPAGSTVFVPTGTYRLTAPLVFSKSLSFVGAGAVDIWGGLATGFDWPGVSPYLGGTVFLVTAAATNAINITGAGVTVNLENFGIRFADSIKYVNTGHGVFVLPPTNSTAYDHGVVGAQWRNVKVFGHDGNHVAFNLTNPLLCQFDHLRSYGGGVMKLINNSVSGAYGNLLINDLYGDVFVGGSAHGIEVVATSGGLNLVQFNRPQVIVEAGGAARGATDPTSAQKMFNAPGTVLTHYSIVAPDFESSMSGCDFGTGNIKTIDAQGLFGTSSWYTSNGHLRTATPTIAAGPGAGTSPAASVVTGDNFGGVISLNIGSAPPAPGQRIATFTWSGQGVRKAVQISPRDAFAGAVGFYVTNINVNGFDIYATGTPASGGGYALTYIAPY